MIACAASYKYFIPGVLMSDLITQPNLENIAQVGGTYHQVLDLGEDRLLAVRTGGLEVFSRRAGTWIPISHLPLCSIPYLRQRVDGVFASFSTKSLRVAVEATCRISLEHSALAAHDEDEPTPACRAIQEGDALYSLGDLPGILSVRMKNGSETIVRLPGYSNPSSIAIAQNRHELFVADVGSIHQIEISGGRPVLSGGYYAAGWPKDVAVDERGVYCANVFGVAWYRETYTYPFIELIDRLSRVHFRVAKVISRKGRVIVCDEARGLHFFAAEGEKLVAKGGLMLEGGAWDCEVVDNQLFVATGDAGWVTAPFDFESMQVGHLSRHKGCGRVQAVVPWKQANGYMVLSSKRISLARPEVALPNMSVTDGCDEHVCAWSGVAIGDHFVVAAGSAGVLLLRTEPSGACKVVFRLKTVEARDLCFDGQFVWVADGRGGIRCCLINTAKSIIEHYGVFPVAGFIRGVLSTGKRIYAGAGDGGLVVLKLDSRGIK